MKMNKMMMHLLIHDVRAEKEGISIDMVKTFMISFKSYIVNILLDLCKNAELNSLK